MANKFLAAVLSFIIPGLGQVYAGDIKRGIIFFIIALVLGTVISLIFKEWFYYIVSFFVNVCAACDAYSLTE